MFQVYQAILCPSYLIPALPTNLIKWKSFAVHFSQYILQQQFVDIVRIQNNYKAQTVNQHTEGSIIIKECPGQSTPISTDPNNLLSSKIYILFSDTNPYITYDILELQTM